MTHDQVLITTIYTGWETYQAALIKAIAALAPDQLDLRAAPGLRSVGENVAHIIGARARWFYLLMGEGGDVFKDLGKWDRRDARPRTPEELVSGLEATWEGMQVAMTRWTAEDWQKTWSGEDAGEPEVITRQWVIWHLIEHDLHHGGECSITLGAHGVRALEL